MNTFPYLLGRLAADHRRELLADADRRRLARHATAGHLRSRPARQAWRRWASWRPAMWRVRTPTPSV
jgi:hypothetical protein